MKRKLYTISSLVLITSILTFTPAQAQDDEHLPPAHSIDPGTMIDEIIDLF